MDIRQLWKNTSRWNQHSKSHWKGLAPQWGIRNRIKLLSWPRLFSPWWISDAGFREYAKYLNLDTTKNGSQEWWSGYWTLRERTCSFDEVSNVNVDHENVLCSLDLGDLINSSVLCTLYHWCCIRCVECYSNLYSRNLLSAAHLQREKKRRPKVLSKS